MVQKYYALESWVTKRGFEYGLLVKTAASLWCHQTSCSIRTVCKCYFCVFNLWFPTSFYARRPSVKIVMRKESYEKGVKFKLKTGTFSRAVGSSDMALAKAEVSCCLIVTIETIQLVLICFTQIQVIKLPFELDQEFIT